MRYVYRFMCLSVFLLIEVPRFGSPEERLGYN